MRQNSVVANPQSEVSMNVLHKSKINNDTLSREFKIQKGHMELEPWRNKLMGFLSKVCNSHGI